ncbi:hypothetical protein RF11_09753 [Thelohanellus kitauei]|uniref:Uncharacterized protein n=1 Tax=Thelohanellus kitauei TaxID=669202 RepID=A0A0C2MZ72_THEKT|nr:hypothetical protein RF11_09753 [Thelohanellus kitauei]
MKLSNIKTQSKYLNSKRAITGDLPVMIYMPKIVEITSTGVPYESIKTAILSESNISQPSKIKNVLYLFIKSEFFDFMKEGLATKNEKIMTATTDTSKPMGEGS